MVAEVDMEIRPVGGKQAPNYPRREDFSPETLKAQPPQRWAANKAALIAMGTLATVLLAGCVSFGGAPLASDIVTEETAGITVPMETPVIDAVLPGGVLALTIPIAPLFVHGNGMGAYGCQMVAPPVFLSEDEALSLINDVAKDYGLEFSAQVSADFTDVLEPSVNIMQPENALPSDTYITLCPDFMDASHGVAIEFVSVEDVKAWHRDTGVGCSVEQYDTVGAAAQLSDALDDAYSATILTAGVLYDPCELSEKSESASREMSVDQLKKQAKDFFEWLKSQGVI